MLCVQFITATCCCCCCCLAGPPGEGVRECDSQEKGQHCPGFCPSLVRFSVRSLPLARLMWYHRDTARGTGKQGQPCVPKDGCGLKQDVGVSPSIYKSSRC